ncbi:MAG TPA: hypothetical protein VF271_00505 [Rhodanobacteraceae bacterium]
MKKLSAMMLLGLMCAGSALAAQSGSGHAQEIGVNGSDHSLPVLVAVNANGKVTKVDPAIDLASAQQADLEKIVHKMVTAPARDKNGKPKASQFVMIFNLEPSKSNPDAYKFVYVRAHPEPLGNLHWIVNGTGLHKKFALSLPQSKSAQQVADLRALNAVKAHQMSSMANRQQH